MERNVMMKAQGGHLRGVVWLAASTVALLTSCATTSTGRKQLQLIPDDQMTELGDSSFAQLKKEVPLTSDPRVQTYVSCVAGNILRAMGEDPEAWEVEVFASDEVNAFALPGKNIGVFEGMLRVADTPDELAAVIAHEVAHVTTKHSEERMSEALLAQAGLTVADALLVGSQAQGIAMAALGLGAQYGILMPHSRTQESEADEIGLRLMAKAGFDPRAAVILWEDMAAQGAGSPPEFLSTHPSHETRIRDLSRLMDEAVAERSSATNTPRCSAAPVRVGARDPGATE